MNGQAQEAAPRPFIGPVWPAWKLLIGLVCAGIVFNNLLRWYPFPPGRSANDMATLDTNLLGIVVNVFLYAAILLTVIFTRSFRLLQYRSWLLVLYCAYLALEVPFRASPLSEAARSGAMILMLLSADWMAAVVVSSARHASLFFRSVWWTMVLTVVAGLVVGLFLPDAVNWGSDRSPSFAQTVRAEFFFFYVLPHYGFALSLATVMLTMRRPGVRFVIALGAAVLVLVLAVLTQTRTMIFSLLLVALVFLFRYARKTLVMVTAVLVVSSACWPAALAKVGDHLRVSPFMTADSAVDATTGRLVLVMINVQSFRDSPIFGQGAVETRRRVEVSDSIAKSEHGYSLHLASSGVFSFLLFAYVIQGLIAAMKILLRGDHGPGSPVIGPYAIATAAVAMASFVTGFFWTFSSATAFYEWFAIFFVSAARVTSQMTWPPRRIPIGA